MPSLVSDDGLARPHRATLCGKCFQIVDTHNLINILVVSRNVHFVHLGSDWGARLARFPRVFFRPLAAVFSGRRVSMAFLGDGEPLSFPDQARETRRLYRVVQA